MLQGCDAPEQDDDFLDSMPAEPLLRCCCHAFLDHRPCTNTIIRRIQIPRDMPSNVWRGASSVAYRTATTASLFEGPRPIFGDDPQAACFTAASQNMAMCCTLRPGQHVALLAHRIAETAYVLFFSIMFSVCREDGVLVDSAWCQPGGLPRQSLAALLLGQTDGLRTAMDLALESGDAQAIVELGKLGCRAMEDRTTDAAILDRILYGGMPQWLARAVGNLAYAGKLADDCGTALLGCL